jgi:transposase-like protein
VLNVQDKLPKRLHAEAWRRLREITEAPRQAECERLRDAFGAEFQAAGQAADLVLRDKEDFVRFDQFPKERRVNLRNSNPIESIFAGVLLRTDAAKPLCSRENVMYLVFKLIARLSQNWRALKRGREPHGLGVGRCRVPQRADAVTA